MTTANNPLDASRLTFSQAQGYAELPRPLRLETISNQARVSLWNLLFSHAADEGYGSSEGIVVVFGGSPEFRPPWEDILSDLHCNHFTLPIDEFRATSRYFRELYREPLLERLTFNQVFDLLQAIMQHPRCPETFTEGVATIFENCRLAYVVNTQQPVTIVPATTQQEGAAVTQAMQQLGDAGLAGAGSHLREASQCINRSDWPGAIRESILAVESVARQLDPEASRTLDPALRSLENQVELHPALKSAFSKLYGYTSDEQGIRHALLDDAQSRAGKDEALFMLSACAAFCSFLLRKYEAEN